MLKRIAQSLWGKFESRDEILKFVKLAAVFFFVIGVYWGMRPLKDSLFMRVVGADWLPYAKMVSLCVIIPLVIVYTKLVDVFPRHKIFYVLLTGYGIIALLFSYAFTQVVDLKTVVASSSNILGWVWYVYVESFGSLVVALFWAFTTDITKPESAARGFPLIAMFGQIGNIFGPLMLRADRFGFSTSGPVVAVIGFFMIVTGLVMWYFVKTTPKSQLIGYEAAEDIEKKHQEEPGFLDGLKLLFSHGYLLAITGIIIFYEVVVTILDFFFKSTAADHFKTTVAPEIFEKSLSNYLSNYAVWTGIVAALCVLLGINNIQRKLGTVASLLLLPVLMAIAVLTLRLNPTLSVAMVLMVFAKAVNYALNQPTIKQLYIPTTKDTKYKAQTWIEMFGSRGSKAIGSGVNALRAPLIGTMGSTAGVAMFVALSSGLSFGLIGVWFFVGIYLAKKYNTAIKENKVVC
jgi:ATP:ADP antiporter, AAA family